MPRGAKPGERRGGRAKGVPNKNTASLKALALPYCPEAIELYVAYLRDESLPPMIRMAAADRLLDRGAGKPPQALTGADDQPLIPPKTVYELHLPGS